METKRLSSSSTSLPSVFLQPNPDGPLNVEVPAGESRFLIRQLDDDARSQEYIFHLRHADSQVQVLGLVKAAGESAPFLRTSVIHHNPATRAETIIRTLALGNAQPRYEGVIHIEKNAQNSESFLNHHSLLLGEAAKSWTLPSLEIEADQVRCSHAATLRTITDADLFYLRSRGLEKDAAKDLLVEAFLADVAEIATLA